jgi:hypothetical protein
MSQVSQKFKTEFKNEFKELVNTIRLQKIKNIKQDKTNKKIKHRMKKLKHAQHKLSHKLQDFAVNLNK